MENLEKAVHVQEKIISAIYGYFSNYTSTFLIKYLNLYQETSEFKFFEIPAMEVLKQNATRSFLLVISIS